MLRQLSCGHFTVSSYPRSTFISPLWETAYTPWCCCIMDTIWQPHLPFGSDRIGSDQIGSYAGLACSMMKVLPSLSDIDFEELPLNLVQVVPPEHLLADTTTPPNRTLSVHTQTGGAFDKGCILNPVSASCLKLTQANGSLLLDIPRGTCPYKHNLSRQGSVHTGQFRTAETGVGANCSRQQAASDTGVEEFR